MIRYAILHRELVRQIDSHSGSWRSRAEERTSGFIRAGKFDEESSIWSQIKPVFMEIQFNKCVFCERQLGDQNFSRVEHDLEHFRPKGRVKKWPPRSSQISFDFTLGESNSRGYYWLAYDLKNYAAACKTCNSSLKSDAFPIAGTRGNSELSLAELKRLEKPYLCYPIGKSDIDPEELIDFVGTVARPSGSRGYKRRRAEVMIEFFKLNERDELQYERAEQITLIGFALEKVERNENRARFEQKIHNSIADNQPHAACKRAFLNLWNSNRSLAKRLLSRAQDLAYDRNTFET